MVCNGIKPTAHSFYFLFLYYVKLYIIECIVYKYVAICVLC